MNRFCTYSAFILPKIVSTSTLFFAYFLNNLSNSSKIAGLFDFPLKKPCIAELDKLSFLAYLL